ncbi:MAG: methylmalonyl Co-A mutase-associated GTPase MeaB [Rhodospirillales bacterium]|nr:methylmalonyl Co-A mutase-associated GTPase MeaB [Rhodospirillales bacterium]
MSVIEAIRNGDRRALARAITLVESSRADDEEQAATMLEALDPSTTESWRVGISGAPGVGKSTFVEVFGLHALEQGRRVAVLAVDPSSTLGGGSILGDKTRMERLARDARAFIRPSPSGGELGGVARRTRDVIRLVEAAGYDLVIVETVGVGQSETAVAAMTDVFLLLLAPGAGDSLQGVKRGVMELADLILVNKADGSLVDAARHVVSDHRAAMALMRPHETFWTPRVKSCSALTGAGMDAVWTSVSDYFVAASEHLAGKRGTQAQAALRDEVVRLATARLNTDPRKRELLDNLEGEVAAGRLSLRRAAQALLGEEAWP